MSSFNSRLTLSPSSSPTTPCPLSPPTSQSLPTQSQSLPTQQQQKSTVFSSAPLLVVPPASELKLKASRPKKPFSPSQNPFASQKSLPFNLARSTASSKNEFLPQKMASFEIIRDQKPGSPSDKKSELLSLSCTSAFIRLQSAFQDFVGEFKTLYSCHAAPLSSHLSSKPRPLNPKDLETSKALDLVSELFELHQTFLSQLNSIDQEKAQPTEIPGLVGEVITRQFATVVKLYTPVCFDFNQIAGVLDSAEIIEVQKPGEIPSLISGGLRSSFDQEPQEGEGGARFGRRRQKRTSCLSDCLLISYEFMTNRFANLLANIFGKAQLKEIPTLRSLSRSLVEFFGKEKMAELVVWVRETATQSDMVGQVMLDHLFKTKALPIKEGFLLAYGLVKTNCRQPSIRRHERKNQRCFLLLESGLIICNKVETERADTTTDDKTPEVLTTDMISKFKYKRYLPGRHLFPTDPNPRSTLLKIHVLLRPKDTVMSSEPENPCFHLLVECRSRTEKFDWLFRLGSCALHHLRNSKILKVSETREARGAGKWNAKGDSTDLQIKYEILRNILISNIPMSLSSRGDSKQRGSQDIFTRWLVPADQVADLGLEETPRNKQFDFEAIIQGLYDAETGVEVFSANEKRKRTEKRFNTQEPVFLCTTAIDWLMRNVGVSRNRAVEIGRTLQLQRHIFSVRDEAFEDKPHLFQFSQGRCLNLSMIWTKPCRDPAKVSIKLLERILELYRLCSCLVPPYGPHTTLSLLCSHPLFSVFKKKLSKLQRVKLADLDQSQKTAFFINVYNTLSLHSFIEYCALDERGSLVEGLEHISPIKPPFFSHTDFYKIDGDMYSILDIEYLLHPSSSDVSTTLQSNQNPQSAGIVTRHRPNWEKGDRRWNHRISSPSPYVIFSLCNCTASSPPINIMRPETVSKQLDEAAASYLVKRVRIWRQSQTPKLILPKLMEWYKYDLREVLLLMIQHEQNHCQKKALEAVLQNFQEEPNAWSNTREGSSAKKKAVSRKKSLLSRSAFLAIQRGPDETRPDSTSMLSLPEITRRSRQSPSSSPAHSPLLSSPRSPEGKNPQGTSPPAWSMSPPGPQTVTSPVMCPIASPPNSPLEMRRGSMCSPPPESCMARLSSTASPPLYRNKQKISRGVRQFSFMGGPNPNLNSSLNLSMVDLGDLEYSQSPQTKSSLFGSAKKRKVAASQKNPTQIEYADYTEMFKYPVQETGEEDLMTYVGGEIMAKSYVFFSSYRTKICMREEIVESKFAFEVPFLFLEFCLGWQEEALQRLYLWYNDLCLCSNTHHEEPIIRLTQEKLQKLISDRQDYSGTLKDLRNMYQNYDGDYNFLTYKPSTYKADGHLRFVATNLHTHTQRVSTQSYKGDVQPISETDGPLTSEHVYDFVTFGAPAAHAYKFRNCLKQLYDSYQTQRQHLSFLEDKWEGYGVKLEPSVGDPLREFEKTQKKEITGYRPPNSEMSLPTKMRVIDSNVRILCEIATKNASNTERGLELCDAITADLREVISDLAALADDKETFKRDIGQLEEWVSTVLLQRQTLAARSHMSVRSTMEPKPVMHDAWDDDIDDIALSEEALASSMRDRELMRSVMGKYRNPYLVGNLIKLELEEIELEMDKRFDAVVCQTLGALVTSLVQKLIVLCHFGDCSTIDQYYSIGILVNFESLLSTIGGELGMLGDMAFGVEVTHRFCVKIEELPVETEREADQGKGESFVRVKIEPKILREEGGKTLREVIREIRYGAGGDTDPYYVLTIFLPGALYSKIKDAIPARKGFIRLVPVLFTQGINEQQSKAIMLGQTEVQERINNASAAKLRLYFDQFRSWSTRRSDIHIDVGALYQEMEKVVSVVASSRREKSTTILPKTSDLCRGVKGLRLTSCKSAKDRTSMAVTWEMARILHQLHALPENEILNVADLLRIQGVRIENAWKNIGKKKFAFNKLQRSLIPEEYRARREVCGVALT